MQISDFFHLKKSKLKFYPTWNLTKVSLDPKSEFSYYSNVINEGNYTAYGMFHLLPVIINSVQWKISWAVIQFQLMILLQSFANVMTTVLTWHVSEFCSDHFIIFLMMPKCNLNGKTLLKCPPVPFQYFASQCSWCHIFQLQSLPIPQHPVTVQ